MEIIPKANTPLKAVQNFFFQHQFYQSQSM